ncbi:MAG: endopeptidase La [Planctomycetales bacterium]|nr:endopeptidase La [bacterium]UNM07014.1 MAG: endopeptidase La [Planctomycetales bacterium]
MSDQDHNQGGIPGGSPPRAEDLPSELPILALKNVVVFPSVVLPIHVSREKSIAAIEAVISERRIIGLLTQMDESMDDPAAEDLYKVGTIGLILRVLRLPEGGARILIQGLSRYKVEKWISEDPYFRARVTPLPEREQDSIQVQAMMRNVNEQFKQYVNVGKNLPTEILVAANNIKEPGKLADLVAANISITDDVRQEVLETIDTMERLEKVNQLLTREIQLLNMSSRIQTQVQEEVGRSQREYFLREQMKAIQRELGEADPKEAEKVEYDKKIAEANMPQEVEAKAREELQRLERMHTESAEASVIRTYLDTLTTLPWNVSSEDEVDIAKARKILDEDHYGLEKVKERLLEFLGVVKLTQRVKGPILCLVGPPGVGKTSLGRSVARAMGRKFVRMSLGGVRDEAEIRGHRRTYVGAMPGRIIQSIRQAGTNNPVIMLDEIDKLGNDFRGDPSSALLEALDPEQNYNFSDHYLEVPFDLSTVLFVATANMLDTIPPALRDRMEVIQLAGYTELEKVKIVQKYILPRQIENHGLKKSALKISPNMIRVITLNYTREAGLRSAEREISKICRKVALKIAEGQITTESISTEEKIQEYLGLRRFEYDEAQREDAVGVVTGLVWTSVGGDIQSIEASFMPGKGQLILTGQLGDVMQESCKAAMTYCRSNSQLLGIDDDLFQKRDIHLHFPAGAIPKDGPSAGITIATAIISLFTERKVSAKVAMTGEITLKGRVLPVGGLKEKLLGAKRAGIKTIIVPQRNYKNIMEIPEDIRKGMTIHYVDHLDEVLALAFVGQGPQPQAKSTAKRSKPGSGKAAGDKQRPRSGSTPPRERPFLY